MKAQNFAEKTTTTTKEMRRHNRLEKVTDFGYSTAFTVLAVTIGALFVLWFLAYTLLGITWSNEDVILNSGICNSAFFSVIALAIVTSVFVAFIAIGKIEKIDNNRFFSISAIIYKIFAVLYVIAFAVVTVWKNWAWFEKHDIVNHPIFSEDALFYGLLLMALLGAAFFYIVSYAPHELELIENKATCEENHNQHSHIAIRIKRFAENHKKALWGFFAFAIVAMVTMIVIITNYKVMPDFLFNDWVFVALITPLVICVVVAAFSAAVLTHYELTKPSTIIWNAHCAITEWNYNISERNSTAYNDIKKLLKNHHSHEEWSLLFDGAFRIISEYGNNGYYTKDALRKIKKAKKVLTATNTETITA